MDAEPDPVVVLLSEVLPEAVVELVLPVEELVLPVDELDPPVVPDPDPVLLEVLPVPELCVDPEELLFSVFVLSC